MYRSPEQQQYAETVRAYLASTATGVLLLHGGAGLGKTRALLIESINAGGRVLVATATTQLVDQMVASTDMAAAVSTQSVAPYISQRQFISPSRAAAFGLVASIGESVEAVLARYGRDIDPGSICLTSRCPPEERQVYLDEKAKCRAADVVVCTHAALLLDVRTRGALVDVTGFDTVIIDEADRLPAAASLQLDADVALAELQRLGVDTRLELVPLLTAALGGVQAEIDATKAEDSRDELRRVQANLAEILSYAVNPDPYHRVGRTNEAILLRVANPARSIRTALERLRKVILTSGTLAIEEGFAAAKHAFGLNNVHPLSTVIEPKDHGRLQFFLAAREIEIDTDAWLDYAAAAIREASAHGRNVLVLISSFEAVDALSKRVPSATVQRRGQNLQGVLATFTGGVLVTPGAWEGVDMATAWDDIVIPRIPYPPPDAVLELPFLSGQDCAMRRLTQGIARGLRRPNQACTIWILDPRFPLPAQLVNQGNVTQGAAAHHLRLVNAIPKRFRDGLRATFRKAEVFHSPRP